MILRIILLGVGFGVIAMLSAFAINTAYTYVVQHPPDVLVDVVTRTKPPAPLPVGPQAPLAAPEGFVATIYSRDVPGARVMVRDSKGTMLVSQTSKGTVTALPDFDGDGQADEARLVLTELDRPHGLVMHCPGTGSTSADQDGCRLFVAETGSLVSYAYDADTMLATEPVTLATFPDDGGHYTRTLLMHPDGQQLLMSVGSSCNVCNESDARRASVLAYDLSTKQVRVFAAGLRNTVFMAVDPVTGDVWGTDNGRDLLGDDTPPDEVNIIKDGQNYGWPICYGNNVHDADFDDRRYVTDPCSAMAAPQIALQAHSAPLGLAFIPEEGWPEDMRNDLIVAYHGSWNRSVPTGYKVVRFDLDALRHAADSPVDFLTGFLAAGADTDAAIGRPVGILAEPGGVAYISDDRAGAIYRLMRTEQW